MPGEINGGNRRRIAGPYELTEADKEAIDRDLEAACKGDIATDREVEGGRLAKYRRG
jgi:hypothetical protein